MGDTELNLLRASVGANQNGRRPASHPELLRNPLI
jgi:hypothetical protein